MNAPSTVMTTERIERLERWIGAQIPGATDVEIRGLASNEIGFSAETLLFSVTWNAQSSSHQREVALRLHPGEPGLLSPYDLAGQFFVLRGLADTAVLAPKALWHEPTGEVLGREFYVMERLDGAVYEQTVPTQFVDDPDSVRTMCLGLIEQLAAIHLVDLAASGLAVLDDGRNPLERELERWIGVVHRDRRGPLPALDHLAAVLTDRCPAPCPRRTLVHGDAKPGNFGYVGDQISVVYDWELATVGEPLTDIGWLEALWMMPVGLPTMSGAPTFDELVGIWERRTGLTAEHRRWYLALALFKMSAINFAGSMLFDQGHCDDLTHMQMGYAIPFITRMGLGVLGEPTDIESGPVMARDERLARVQQLVPELT